MVNVYPWDPYGRVYVLRLGHRPARDKRVTTHVALVARALGANGFILEGVCDERVERSLKRTLQCWGGEMEYVCGVDGREYVEEWKKAGGEVVHLTMYGLPVDEVIGVIAASGKPKLIIVEAERVEGYYYRAADYNVAVGNQPHSEVAALAILLDRLYRGRELYTNFYGARAKIVPTPGGKVVAGGVEC